MPKFNDINLNKWKDSDIWTDSLWIIQERDKLAFWRYWALAIDYYILKNYQYA
ncbi:hypothetical protein KAR28_01880 [Candidatus Parcubacteria bacterium]|nr:hypothetical protein [Candidatus Parcubacteria bacterium]